MQAEANNTSAQGWFHCSKSQFYICHFKTTTKRCHGFLCTYVAIFDAEKNIPRLSPQIQHFCTDNFVFLTCYLDWSRWIFGYYTHGREEYSLQYIPKGSHNHNHTITRYNMEFVEFKTQYIGYEVCQKYVSKKQNILPLKFFL